MAIGRFVRVVAAVVLAVAELRLVDAKVVVQAQELVRRTLKLKINFDESLFKFGLYYKVLIDRGLVLNI